MAGDTITVPESSMVMIHNPWALTAGDAGDHRKAADVLDKIGGQLAGIYAKRSGLKRAKVADMMAAETWMTGDEAVALGFADAVSD
jgi:ATP-dependent protease ClpP protease subunit